jgi:hypothetical protein
MTAWTGVVAEEIENNRYAIWSRVEQPGLGDWQREREDSNILTK